MELPDEPPVLPPNLDTGAIVQRVYYCLECGNWRESESDMVTHWMAAHRPHGERDRPENGIHYARGAQVILMDIRRKKWVAEQAEQFSGLLHPGFGPDDFIAEAEIGDSR